MKYHKEIFFRPQDINKLKNFSNSCNMKDFLWSFHAKNQLKERFNNIQYFFNWIQKVKFVFENIIEYTTNSNGELEKALFRFSYDGINDILISISTAGKILTIWTNNKEDKHITLNKNEYSTI